MCNIGHKKILYDHHMEVFRIKLEVGDLVILAIFGLMTFKYRFLGYFQPER